MARDSNLHMLGRKDVVIAREDFGASLRKEPKMIRLPQESGAARE